MIFKEYALEPCLLNRKDNCKYWLTLFKLRNGRQISSFPKKWKKLVFQSIDDCMDVEKKYIETRLQHLPNSIFRSREHTWDKNPHISWLDNAIKEDSERPFHAIITKEKVTGNKKILVGDDVDDQHDLLNVSPSKSIKRDIDGIIGWIIPFLQQASEFVFVDPYFKPGNRDFTIVLEEMLKAIKSRGEIGRSVRMIQYHCVKQYSGTDDFFIEQCKNRIIPILPDGYSIEFYRWDSHDMHNRYVLSDTHGGVTYGHGLSVGAPGGTEITDDISYLSQDAYNERWEKYAVSDKNPIYEATR